MAELSLRERLQPALIDRLVDDDRLVTLFETTVRPDELKRVGLTERELADILQGQGLRPASGAKGALSLAAPAGRVALS